MAGPRETGLRRVHVRAIELIEMVTAQLAEADGASVDFVLGIPDSRVHVALAVLFAPEGTQPALEPGNTLWDNLFVPSADNHTSLVVMGRETAAEQGNNLLFADPVFGTFSAPAPLPGDTFGWLISDDRPDVREWYCRLRVLHDDPGRTEHLGRWMAKATFTDATGGMHPEEWERAADRRYLRRLTNQLPRVTWGGLPT